MPGWGAGTAESAYGSWTLIHLIRQLPQLTPDEFDEMAKLNPKSPEEWKQIHEEEAFLLGDGAPGPETGEHHDSALRSH